MLGARLSPPPAPAPAPPPQHTSRLESLLNFQTMVADLTGMAMSNASLLDEATAAAEAMTMCSAVARGKKPRFLVSDKCHPQTIAVCQTRADGLGLKVEVMDEASFPMDSDVCGVLLQYPATDGSVHDYSVRGPAQPEGPAKQREPSCCLCCWRRRCSVHGQPLSGPPTCKMC